MSDHQDTGQAVRGGENDYWHANLRLIAKLLFVWAVVSFGCGILWVDWLNQFQLFGFKLGFWFAQQGALYTFVVLIFIYVHKINALDRQYGFEEQEDEPVGKNGTGE